MDGRSGPVRSGDGAGRCASTQVQVDFNDRWSRVDHHRLDSVKEPRGDVIQRNTTSLPELWETSSLSSRPARISELGASRCQSMEPCLGDHRLDIKPRQIITTGSRPISSSSTRHGSTTFHNDKIEADGAARDRKDYRKARPVSPTNCRSLSRCQMLWRQ